MFTWKRLSSLILVFSVLILSSCGKKTEPKPPEAVRPKPPAKVHVNLHFWGAELVFRIPKKKIDGRPLDGLEGFQIVRYGKTLEGPMARFRREVRIPLTKKEFEQLKDFVYHDRSLRSGVRYYYVIRAIRGWRCVSDPAQSPAFSWHTPPKAPERLTAEGRDGEVVLSWSPVLQFLDGLPVNGAKIRYRLYRRIGTQGPYRALPGLVVGKEFIDQEVQNERTYCYRVAGVLSYFGSLIEGPKGPEACATPHDLTPPRPPEGLVAIPMRGGVLLRWRRNGEPDLWGYLVYRKVPGKPVERLTPKPIPEPHFFDAHLPGPGLYYYWVTAVDRSPRHNESAPSEKVSVEILPKEEH